MIKGFGRGGRRDLTVKHARPQNKSTTKPRMRTVQGKPMRGISLFMKMGNTIPPIDDPATTMPRAAARYLKNQVRVELVAQLKTAAAPTPQMMPCVRMIW